MDVLAISEYDALRVPLESGWLAYCAAAREIDETRRGAVTTAARRTRQARQDQHDASSRI
jgi:hypothetical protein